MNKSYERLASALISLNSRVPYSHTANKRLALVLARISAYNARMGGDRPVRLELRPTGLYSIVWGGSDYVHELDYRRCSGCSNIMAAPYDHCQICNPVRGWV